MKPEQYERLTELFHAAVELTSDQRAVFLNQACNGDPDLRRELESLLDVRDHAFTETPPHDIAAAFMAQQGVNSAGAPSLAPNTPLDRYVIHSLIGKGGMGEVYLAEDMRLHRNVALKILPAKFASNQDRMRRFEQEAQAAAALNHPNIAHIYEIGESESTHFIAIEYIDGDTLRDRIHRDKAPLPKVLNYLIQVAEGLGKAHAAGIVHRDLKPDNIMITGDGYAKILDFGLAKLIESESTSGEKIGVSSESDPIDMPLHSLAGMVMGTAGYMSPEQAQGKVKEIDQRSDIFSFGCILFEAVTGQKAFPHGSVIKSLSKVGYQTAPPVKDYNSDAPNDLERIVRRCLAKDREERYQTIRDVAVELKEVSQRITGAADFKSGVLSPANSSRGQTTATTSRADYVVSTIIKHKSRALLAVAAVVIAIITIAWLLPRGGGIRGPIQAVSVKRLTPDMNVIDPTLSPSGDYLAYVKFEKGRKSIWLRDMASGKEVETMPVNTEDYGGLRFSPDGKQMYYSTGRPDIPNATIVRVPVGGGESQLVVGNIMSNFAVSPDGKQVAFVRGLSLVLASTEGKGERNLITLSGATEGFVTWGSQLSWSPDGARIAVCGVQHLQGKDNFELIDASVTDGTRRIIPTPEWTWLDDVAWLADGASLLVTAREKEGDPLQIWRVRYPNGETIRVTNDSNNYDGLSLTVDSRTLVAGQSFSRQNIWLASLSDPRNAKQLTTSALAADGYSGLALTLDDKIIFTSPRSGNVDLWRMNSDGSDQQQLTGNAGNLNKTPRLTPDGRYIIFVSSRTGTKHIWRMDADGRNVVRLTDSPDSEDMPNLSADGQWVYYSVQGEAKPFIMKVPIYGGDGVSVNFFAFDAIPSPDGKLLAGTVYLDKLKHPWKTAITSTEGGEPLALLELPAFGSARRWTDDSKSIVYINGGEPELWQQPIDGRPPTKIFALSNDRLYNFAISKDFQKVAYSLGNESTEAVLISSFAKD
jgi:serine/threonine protein kinase/Tol biopolymer transport system component